MMCLCVCVMEKENRGRRKRGREREGHCYYDPLGHGGGRITVREWAMLMETKVD